MLIFFTLFSCEFRFFKQMGLFHYLLILLLKYLQFHYYFMFVLGVVNVKKKPHTFNLNGVIFLCLLHVHVGRYNYEFTGWV